jgi:hypothetical protein
MWRVLVMAVVLLAGGRRVEGFVFACETRSVGMAEVPVTETERAAMGLGYTRMVLVPLMEERARVAGGWAYSGEELLRWRAVWCCGSGGWRGFEVEAG